MLKSICVDIQHAYTRWHKCNTVTFVFLLSIIQRDIWPLCHMSSSVSQSLRNDTHNITVGQYIYDSMLYRSVSQNALMFMGIGVCCWCLNILCCPGKFSLQLGDVGGLPMFVIKTGDVKTTKGPPSHCK